MRKSLIALCGFFMLGACSKPNNPLLSATDGQFIQIFAPSVFNECNERFFEPSKVQSPELSDKKGCAEIFKQTAAFLGIAQVVTLAHIEDPRVKERYFKLKTP